MKFKSENCTDLADLAEKVESVRSKLLFGNMSELADELGGMTTQHFLQGMAFLDLAVRSFKMCAISANNQKE